MGDPILFEELAKMWDNGTGRPIEELIRTNEILKGQESQRLRIYFSSNCMEPMTDLEEYGRLIFSGDVEIVKLVFYDLLAAHGVQLPPNGKIPAGNPAAKEISKMRWGPTRVPIFDLLLLAIGIRPSQRAKYLDITRFLAHEAHVPVDGIDLSGTQAISHAISTKPSLEIEFAEILYDAGADLNIRNRYGQTAAAEMCQVFITNNLDRDVDRAGRALKWFLSHGGNVDVKCGDQYTARMTANMIAKKGIKKLKAVIDQEDTRRKERGGKCCTLCGREDKKLLECSRCRKARYCERRSCQRVDWPRHKAGCTAS